MTIIAVIAAVSSSLVAENPIAEVSLTRLAIIYRSLVLLAGCLFATLGYSLFRLGIWGNSGDLEASFKDNKLVLRSAAPGTFFVVAGTLIVVVSLFLSPEIEGSSIEQVSLNQPQIAADLQIYGDLNDQLPKIDF